MLKEFATIEAKDLIMLNKTPTYTLYLENNFEFLIEAKNSYDTE